LNSIEAPENYTVDYAMNLKKGKYVWIKKYDSLDSK